jgi:hypothetical protein
MDVLRRDTRAEKGFYQAGCANLPRIYAQHRCGDAKLQGERCCGSASVAAGDPVAVLERGPGRPGARIAGQCALRPGLDVDLGLAPGWLRVGSGLALGWLWVGSGLALGWLWVGSGLGLGLAQGWPSRRARCRRRFPLRLPRRARRILPAQECREHPRSTRPRRARGLPGEGCDRGPDAIPSGS